MMLSRRLEFWSAIRQTAQLRILILSCVCLCYCSSIEQKTQADEQAGPRRTSLSSPSRSRTLSDSAGQKRTLKLKTSQQEEPSPPANPEIFKARELSEKEKHVTLEQAREFVDRVNDILWWESEEKLFAESRFGELICDGFPGSTPQLRDVREEMGADGSRGFVDKIKEIVERGNDYSEQKIYLRNDRRYVRFRLLHEDGAVNYHEFQLINLPSGVFAEDVYLLASGENHSKTLHRLMAAILEDQRLGLLKFLPGMRSPMFQNLENTWEMGKYVQTDPQKTLAIFDSLPEAVQQDKVVMLFRVFASGKLEDESLYTEALSAFQKQFPNDPSGLLLSIDSFMLQGKYAECLQAVNTLDESIGGDPFLNLQRAMIAMKEGDAERGVQLALQVSEDLPEILPAHWIVVAVLLLAEEHQKTLDFLKLIDDRFEMQWNDLSEVEMYSKFVKSPQYEEWLKYLREQERKKPVPIEQTL